MLNVWRCDRVGCKAVAHGVGSPVSLTTLGWYVEAYTGALSIPGQAGGKLLCPTCRVMDPKARRAPVTREELATAARSLAAQRASSILQGDNAQLPVLCSESSHAAEGGRPAGARCLGIVPISTGVGQKGQKGGVLYLTAAEVRQGGHVMSGDLIVSGAAEFLAVLKAAAVLGWCSPQGAQADRALGAYEAGKAEGEARLLSDGEPGGAS